MLTGYGRGAGPKSLAGARGFTLVELMLAVTIIAILSMIAIPQYHSAVRQARVTLVTTEIRYMSKEIDKYRMLNNQPPPDLATVGLQDRQDAWGRKYVYLNVQLVLANTIPGKPRKTKVLKPINRYYDLFSVGPDGVSKANIAHKDSLDDIIRANDGDYVDVARKY